jgi:hypothetical protein
MRAREADVSDNVILVFGASPGNYAVETVALFPPLSPRRAPGTGRGVPRGHWADAPVRSAEKELSSRTSWGRLPSLTLLRPTRG